MSQVQAISGATSTELVKLTNKAKEMGATTKFTAEESAQAFNYMAMAGWKTDDMLNGIEGILSLAAASGEDLATTSDIVTDALTAFNMKLVMQGISRMYWHRPLQMRTQQSPEWVRLSNMQALWPDRLGIPLRTSLL